MNIRTMAAVVVGVVGLNVAGCAVSPKTFENPNRILDPTASATTVYFIADRESADNAHIARLRSLMVRLDGPASGVPAFWHVHNREDISRAPQVGGRPVRERLRTVRLGSVLK